MRASETGNRLLGLVGVLMRSFGKASAEEVADALCARFGAKKDEVLPLVQEWMSYSKSNLINSAKKLSSLPGVKVQRLACQGKGITNQPYLLHTRPLSEEELGFMAQLYLGKMRQDRQVEKEGNEVSDPLSGLKAATALVAEEAKKLGIVELHVTGEEVTYVQEVRLTGVERGNL